MDFVKKNYGILILFFVAALIAVYLGVKMKQTAFAAGKAAAEVESLRQFAERERRAPYSSTQENFSLAEQNLTTIQSEDQKLRMELYSRSKIDFDTNVNGIACKNKLINTVRGFREEFRKNLIQLGTSAEGFSFNDTISSEKLPDETVEVPVLMKQLEVVREVVRLLIEADIKVLHDLQRPGGTGVAKRDDFSVMPFHVRIEGELPAVKAFLSKLQGSSKCFFVIRKVAFSAADVATEGVAAQGPGHPSGFGPSTPPMMPTAGGRPLVEEKGEEKVISPKTDRQVLFSPAVTADIRFDLIEFNNPIEEN